MHSATFSLNHQWLIFTLKSTLCVAAIIHLFLSTRLSLGHRVEVFLQLRVPFLYVKTVNLYSRHPTPLHMLTFVLPVHPAARQALTGLPLGPLRPHLFISAAYMATALVIRPCLEMWSGCKWSSVYWRSAGASATRLGPSVLPRSLPSPRIRRGRNGEPFQKITYVRRFYPVFSALFICSKQTEPCCHSPRDAKAHHFLRERCGKMLKAC